MRSNNVFVILIVLIAFQRCTNATWFFPFPFPWGPLPRHGDHNNVNFPDQGNFPNLGNFPGQGGFPDQVNFPDQGNFPDPNQGSDQGNFPDPGQGGQGNAPAQSDQAGSSNPFSAAASLKMLFYNSTCPNAEKIVRDTIKSHYNKDPTIAAGIMRLFFHDCFVRGCDASLLLDSTPSGQPVEKAAGANGFTLNGDDVIEAVKSALEKACPGVVSCADILSFAAREAAVLAGLREFQVAGGRRDGTVSIADEVPVNLPSPLQPLDQLTQMFANKGFSQAEMVVLTGAHSIGGAHCFTFVDRIYNNTPVALDSILGNNLKRTCPFPQQNHDITKDAKVDFDPSSSMVLDGSYYNRILSGKALLSSDQALMSDRKTSTIVQRMATDPAKWKRKFTKALIKVGQVQVLVGNQGEIRKKCKAVNGN
ncbi:hypothetical protein LUZ60_012866 [Juncus effusus]|nr:hypothetical protein LUZ60_012866 [Juncus effusus]